MITTYFLRRALLLAFLTLATGNLVHADDISIVADPYLPYTGAPNSDQPGFMIEVAKSIFEKAGHTVSYKQQAWTDAFNEAKNANVTAIAGASKEDLPGFIFPEVEQAQAQGVFYVKAGSSWKYSGVGSLESICIGVINKYHYSEIQTYVNANRTNSQKTRVFSDEDALSKLADAVRDGKIQAFMEDENVMKTFLKSYPDAGQITDAGKVKAPTKLYIAFPSSRIDSAAYAKLLSDGMKAMRADGSLAKILKKYDLQDW